MIEVVPLKKGEPIFILKNQQKAIDVYGHTMSHSTDNKVIIHCGNFIWNQDRIHNIGFITNGKCSKSQLLPAEKVADDTYIKRHKAYPPKEFSITSILDKKIPLYGTRYIRPIKKLFVKYGILKSKSGKASKLSDIGKERRRFVVEELKAIALGKRANDSMWEIWDRWCGYVDEHYGEAKNVDDLYFDYTTIWRDCKALKNCTKR